VAASYLLFAFLTACFFRFSVQLANGLLDASDPDTRVVLVTGQKISLLGGSLKESLNPLAHLVYFQGWDGGDETYEVLVPPAVYYFAGPGTRIAVTLRKGFLHLPWVEDCQLLQTSGSGA